MICCIYQTIQPSREGQKIITLTATFGTVNITGFSSENLGAVSDEQGLEYLGENVLRDIQVTGTRYQLYWNEACLTTVGCFINNAL